MNEKNPHEAMQILVTEDFERYLKFINPENNPLPEILIDFHRLMFNQIIFKHKNPNMFYSEYLYVAFEQLIEVLEKHLSNIAMAEIRQLWKQIC